MAEQKFRPFAMMRQMRQQQKVLGWQYEMIYLGGDPYNPEQAVVTVRALEKAIVIRSVDGNEESFQSVMIPYGVLNDVVLVDEETGNMLCIGEKAHFGDTFNKVLLRYNDGGQTVTLQLRMAMDADLYKNSKLCKNMQEYAASRMKRSR